ncbi:FecR protein [Pedobacter steynii]|uniref:FecR protein n=1 Tax=Pedobacter steynii TaxID=430522 RepID=A0A1G9Y8D8_9SPHI|nr:FecR family protein [Pedobacter steynii]NQX39636.1 FecR family protein [Pedobacter steynii]SDN05287.1 FecR protein [Pedobacter steynii]
MMEKTDEIRLQEIAHKYLQGKLNKEEQTEFDDWFKQITVEPIELFTPYAKDEYAHRQVIFKRIKKELGINRPRIATMWRRIAAAAIVILTIGLGLLFIKYREIPPGIAKIIHDETIPGKSTATLTLSNGQEFALSDAVDETLLKKTGTEVYKTINGQLIYKQKNKISTAHLAYNTLTTSRGEQYQLILPDGSHIWLNSESSVQFPASFSGLKERKVLITGEAYFEVAKDKSKPFRVVSDGQLVTVHGTHFNINGYKNEPETKTTLLEGSVDINGTLLKPEQQAILDKNEVKVISVDTKNVIAWKNGYFNFSDESLESIMRKVSRWYDVDVIFQDQSLKNIEFGGVMTRYTKVSEVLEMLELTGEVSFGLKGKKIIVKNNN